MSELSRVLKDAVPPTVPIPAVVIERRLRRRQRRMRAAGVAAAVMAAAVMVVSFGEFGRGSSDRAELSLPDVISVTGDYEPIETRAELAAASDIVVEAVLVEAVDGRIFGDSPDDEFAGRFLRLVFESSDIDERLLVEIPRPSESPSFDEVVAVAPIGARSVLYLSRIDTPDDETQFWHGLPDDEDLFQLTLPEGWILDQDGVRRATGKLSARRPSGIAGSPRGLAPGLGAKAPTGMNR